MMPSTPTLHTFFGSKLNEEVRILNIQAINTTTTTTEEAEFCFERLDVTPTMKCAK
jgi:hypothetical protein